MRIRFYNTLYKREDSYTLPEGEDFKFEDGRVVFNWCGCGRAIELEYVIAIERL